MMGVPGKHWPENEWYESLHRGNETPEFNDWFVRIYELPVRYEDTREEQDEFWRRKAFALKGWLAGIEQAGERRG